MNSNGGSAALLKVDNLFKHFPVTAGILGKTVAEVQAVSGVSFEIAGGETLGLVGESGCGKTTAGRCILRLLEPTAGRIEFDGLDITQIPMRALRPLRRNMQIIFQDPYSSLNPRMTVRDAVGEPLLIHRVARRRDVDGLVAQLLERVGLPAQWMNRYPHEFSGGQRQRIGIARAIALNPKFIVCDEAVSALDVSVRAQVINLLIRLREEMGLSYLFIAHDLSVVKHISHRIAVMYLGHLMEVAPTRSLFEKPAHPYTLALLSAIPVPEPGRKSTRIRLTGDVPTPLNPPGGCRFHTRCPAVFERCMVEEPPLFDIDGEHRSKCWLNDGLCGREDWQHGFMERYSANVEKNLAQARISGGFEREVELEETSPMSEAPVQAEDEISLPARRHRLESDTGFKRRIGILAALAGFCVALAENVSLGVVIILLAFAALVFPGARKKDALALFLIALLGVSATGGYHLERFRDKRQALQQFDALHASIDAYQEATGQFPESMHDLGWRVYGIFPKGDAMDPWGGNWYYRLNEDKKTYDLRSAGPDRKFYSDDDVRF